MTLSAGQLSLVGRLCTGCGACQAIASDGRIEMRLTDRGFLRPFVERALSREDQRRISAICPGIGLARHQERPHDHPIWGPIVHVRAGHATDAGLRHRASSGGVLSAVLHYLLEHGLVDRIVQTAASAHAPIENATVESMTFRDVFSAAGSRYAPSAPLSDIIRELDRPGRFAFVGKPCDIAALRAYALHNPVVDEKIPYLVSFFCGGIPSLRGTRAILAGLGCDEGDVIRFRYRGEGWPGSATATTRDGRMRQMSYADAWGGILSKHLQFRCKICPDGSGGFADFVCADAWYGDERGFPVFDEAPGRSLVITRTAKGEDIVRDARYAGYVDLEDIDIDEIEKMQPYQARTKQLVISRLAALALFGHATPRYTGLHLWRAALMAGWRRNLRSFAGMVRRILMRRLGE